MEAIGLLKIAIVSLCINSTSTKVQMHECAAVMGSCIVNYNTEQVAFDKCKEKWTKVKDEIR